MQGITITLEELLALRYEAQQLHLPQNKNTSHPQQGNYQSPLRGRGMDFVETRVYQPGDDIRAINWAVTARTGKPHTKIYQQERERPIYLIVDFNTSMFFGTKTAYKSVIAARVAATIAWAAIKNGDRIGGLLLKDEYKIIPPGQRKQNLIEFFKQLICFVEPTNNGEINYPLAFMKLKKAMRSGSLIYFLSDFYSLNRGLENELLQLSRHNEVTNIFIYDILEKDLPPSGSYLFHDPLKAKSLLIDTTSQSVRTKYQALFIQRMEKLKRLCFASGMDMLELATHQSIGHVLRPILIGRKK